MDKLKLKKNLAEAVKQCSFKKDIKRVLLFGSYVKGNPRKDSDVDLSIEFYPSAKIGFFNFIGIKEEIEKFVGKHIDLLTPDALSEYFRKDVLRQAEIIYER